VAVAGGDIASGPGQVEQLKVHARLQPDEHVLDVGCGVGRTAIPLTSFLSPRGGYEGIDVSRAAIEWCRNEITPRFSNFRFEHVDMFNATYNPQGVVTASELKLPYDDARFDLAFLYSVFTHVLLPDLERYVAEIARVLKKGGRVLASFFLLNDASLGQLAAAPDAVSPEGHRVAAFLLKRDLGGYRSGYEMPEAMVAYHEDSVRDLYREHGLEVAEIHYGEWVEWVTGASGRHRETKQDAIVAYR
jgi:SAM-dependent methyltransferase